MQKFPEICVHEFSNCTDTQGNAGLSLPPNSFVSDMQMPAEHRVRSSKLHGQNQWPDSRPSFSIALRAYVDVMDGLGEAIMQGIALGLGLPATFFKDQPGGEPYWVLRVIHYPPIPDRSSGHDSVSAKVFSGLPHAHATMPVNTA
jgi:isopenicillin N synthase-like dioxygenase